MTQDLFNKLVGVGFIIIAAALWILRGMIEERDVKDDPSISIGRRMMNGEDV